MFCEKEQKLQQGDGGCDDRDDGVFFPDHPGHILNAPRDNISRKGNPSLRPSSERNWVHPAAGVAVPWSQAFGFKLRGALTGSCQLTMSPAESTPILTEAAKLPSIARRTTYPILTHT